MNLADIQSEAWQCAESKGLHATLDGVPLGLRETRLLSLMDDYAKCTYEAQHIKRTGNYPPFWSEDDGPCFDDLTQPMMASIIRLVLIHTEVDEAIEQVGDRDKLLEELADIVIRVADLAETVGGNLAESVQQKIVKNWQRPHQYGTPDQEKPCA